MKIVSGGQTGADRAALDFAIAHGIAHGGWCPAGRRAEDGPLDTRYRLMETTGKGYRARTVRNARDGDATPIVNLGELEGGTLETRRTVERLGKPVRIVQADEPPDEATVAELRAWLDDPTIGALNVAGPRESKRPGAYRATLDLLERLFALP